MQDLFAPPAEQWRPISPRWKQLRLITTLIVPTVIMTIPAVLVGVITGLWWIAAILWAIAIVIVAVRGLLIGRSYRAWGYALREDDLYITHGVFLRTLTAVPYGRMQAVEVNSGPLERAFKIATVQLITASPSSNAQIVGLPPEEASQLRDQLTSLGERQASGL